MSRWRQRWPALLAALYLLVAWGIIWRNSDFSSQYQAWSRSDAADREVFSKEVRLVHDKLMAEAKAIVDRLNSVGFTNFDQFLKDRNRLVQVRHLCHLCQTSGNAYKLDEEHEFYALWKLTDDGVRLCVDQLYKARRDHDDVLSINNWKDVAARRQVIEDSANRFRSADVRYSGTAMAWPDDVPLACINFSQSWPLGAFMSLVLGLYLAITPLALLFHLRRLAQLELPLSRTWPRHIQVMGFFSIVWPCAGWYDPRQLELSHRQFWLGRVSEALGRDRYQEVIGFIRGRTDCYLDDLEAAFPDVAWLIARCRSSRWQRVLVTVSIILAMFRINTRTAVAQEVAVVRSDTDIGRKAGNQEGVAKDASKTARSSEAVIATATVNAATIHYLVGKSSVQVAVPGSEPITLSWRNTFGKVIATATRSNSGSDSTSRAVMLQPRLRMTHGPWSAFGQVTLRDNGLSNTLSFDEANLSWTSTVLGGQAIVLGGRFFLPTLAGIPPPFVGPLASTLTSSLSTPFGTGLSGTLERDGLKASVALYSPATSVKAPSHWQTSVTCKWFNPVQLDFMSQFGPNPDEEWLLAGEACWHPTDQWQLDLMAVAREKLGGEIGYGGRLWLEWRFLPQLAVFGQGELLYAEKPRGSDRVDRRWRLTTGVWFAPTDILRLQAEVAVDRQQGKSDREAVELTVGAIARF